MFYPGRRRRKVDLTRGPWLCSDGCHLCAAASPGIGVLDSAGTWRHHQSCTGLPYICNSEVLPCFNFKKVITNGFATLYPKHEVHRSFWCLSSGNPSSLYFLCVISPQLPLQHYCDIHYKSPTEHLEGKTSLYQFAFQKSLPNNNYTFVCISISLSWRNYFLLYFLCTVYQNKCFSALYVSFFLLLKYWLCINREIKHDLVNSLSRSHCPNQMQSIIFFMQEGNYLFVYFASCIISMSGVQMQYTRIIHPTIYIIFLSSAVNTLSMHMCGNYSMYFSPWISCLKVPTFSFRLYTHDSGLYRQQSAHSSVLDHCWTKVRVNSLSKNELFQVNISFWPDSMESTFLMSDNAPNSILVSHISLIVCLFGFVN